METDFSEWKSVTKIKFKKKSTSIEEERKTDALFNELLRRDYCKATFIVLFVNWRLASEKKYFTEKFENKTKELKRTQESALSDLNKLWKCKRIRDTGSRKLIKLYKMSKLIIVASFLLLQFAVYAQGWLLYFRSRFLQAPPKTVVHSTMKIFCLHPVHHQNTRCSISPYTNQIVFINISSPRNGWRTILWLFVRYRCI